MPEKNCRAIVSIVDDVTLFEPESPELINSSAISIYPDEDGVQWYWTPDAPAAS